MVVSIDIESLSTYAIYCLIEALHEDVDDGDPTACGNLQLCQSVIRRRNANEIGLSDEAVKSLEAAAARGYPRRGVNRSTN